MMLSNETADLLTALATVRSLDELWSETSRYLNQLGFTHSIYAFVRPGDDGATRLWTSLPDYWRDRYVDQDYQRVDPYFRYCCETFEPIRTGPDYLPRHNYLTEPERHFIKEAGETGFRSGFSAPVRLVGRAGFGGWNFGTTFRRKELEAAFDRIRTRASPRGIRHSRVR